MIVYKVLVNIDGKLYSSNKREEVADCLKELYVRYELHKETKGILFHGVNSKLFAFTTENEALFFRRSCMSDLKDSSKYKIEVYKCLAFGCSTNIFPLRTSVLSNLAYKIDTNNYLFINDKQTFNEAVETSKELAVSPEGYWNSINQIKKSHKKLKPNYRLIQSYHNSVACDVIIPTEKIA